MFPEKGEKGLMESFINSSSKIWFILATRSHNKRC